MAYPAEGQRWKVLSSAAARPRGPGPGGQGTQASPCQAVYPGVVLELGDPFCHSQPIPMSEVGDVSRLAMRAEGGRGQYPVPALPMPSYVASQAGSSCEETAGRWPPSQLSGFRQWRRAQTQAPLALPFPPPPHFSCWPWLSLPGANGVTEVTEVDGQGGKSIRDGVAAQAASTCSRPKASRPCLNRCPVNCPCDSGYRCSERNNHPEQLSR